MSNPKTNSFEKTSPNNEKTSAEKTDKLWISAALVALLVGFGAADAKAEGGLLGGLGNSVNNVTAGLTSTLDAGVGSSSDSTHLGLSSHNDLSAEAGDKSVDASLGADVNAAAESQGENIGLSGVATSDSFASVNLSDANQATSAHVTNSGAIVLQ